MWPPKPPIKNLVDLEGGGWLILRRHYMHYTTLHYTALHYTTIHTYIKHACMHAHIRTYIHTHIHTYVHTYIHTYIHTLQYWHSLKAYIHAHLRDCIHAWVQRCIHAIMHTSIHTLHYITYIQCVRKYLLTYILYVDVGSIAPTPHAPWHQESGDRSAWDALALRAASHGLLTIYIYIYIVYLYTHYVFNLCKINSTQMRSVPDIQVIQNMYI